MDQKEMINRYRGPSIDASYQASFHLAKPFQRRRFFRNQPIRNKNCLWRPCLLMDQNEMSNLYRGPPIDAAYQVAVDLAKRFQRRRFFRNQPIRDKNCLWRPCFVNVWGRNEQCLQRTFHRCFLPSFGSFGKAFQRKIFLEIDQSETRIAGGGHIC